VTLTIDDIPRCFEGEIPNVVSTVSADGTPNLVHVSHVFRVDAQHVAISNQFLRKSMANLDANPVAMILCVDPATLDSYRVLVRRVRTETSGPTYEVVERALAAIAALTGMTDVFALRSVEVLRVLQVEPVPTAATAGAR
jgi:adenylate cyclase